MSMNKTLSATAGLLLSIGCFSQVQAATVTATASGSNNAIDAGFWTISYGAGDSAISSVSIDLSTIDISESGVTEVIFDFDGVGTFDCNPLCVSFADEAGAVFSSGSGLLESDVTFNWTGPAHSSILSIDFSGFVAGDSFSFSANTNGIAGGVDTGFNSGDALAGALFRVYFADGSSGSATFLNDCGPTCSLAIVDTAVVPVPAAVWLFGSGLLGLVGVARRRR